MLPALLAGLFNPNLCSEEAGPGFAAAERRAIAMTADLVGFNPARAGGVFTFGGTGTLLYGVKVGLEKACPGTLRRGVQPGAVVLCSEQAHYAVLNAAGWLGLGEEQVQHVPTDADNMRSSSMPLDQQAREHLLPPAGRSRPSWPRSVRPMPLAWTILPESRRCAMPGSATSGLNIGPTCTPMP